LPKTSEYSSYAELYLEELFPSAIMFGMSSKDFWEEDPQLYWSYRTFYIKKIEQDAESENYKAWLHGSYNCLAVSIALNNGFSKQKIEYPKEPFGNNKNETKTQLQEKLKDVKDKDILNQMEFNYWARL
jgi:hypothetical protein